MARLNKDRETSKLPVSYTKALLSFNVTKQRIVDLCNADYDDDPFEDEKNYSTWHRALDGKEVWEEIPDRIIWLYEEQIRHPRKYLPQEAPPEENLNEWMKQIATARWWRDVLQVSASQSAFNAWFSGRPMGKAKIAEVKEAVAQWWGKLIAAVEQAEAKSRASELFQASYRKNPHAGLESYFYIKITEQGMTVNEAREHFVELFDLHYCHYAHLIDLSDPKNPLESTGLKPQHVALLHSEALEMFEKIIEDDFPGAVGHIAPEFDREPKVEIKRWGDRRNEDCPKDLNEALYNLWYKVRLQKHWNADKRRIETSHDILEVSNDGEIWRPANSREQDGWDAGTFYFCQHLNEHDEVPVNSYTRERCALERRIQTRRDEVTKRRKFSVGFEETEAFAEAVDLEIAQIEKEISQLHL